MKNYASTIITVVTVFIATYAFHQISSAGNGHLIGLQGRISALELENKMYQAQNRLLQDQVNDVEAQLANRSTKTYEQGFADAINRSKDQNWVDGYHAGIAQNGIENIYSTPMPTPISPAAPANK